MMDKQTLRAQMRALRKSFTPKEQRLASLAVHERLSDFAPYQAAQCVMAYIACRGELSLAPAIDEIIACGRMLVLPRCEAPGVMTARRVTDMAQLIPGAFGLMEPDAACEIVPPEEIDLILAPGVAFDREGRRLGQGGGYYDRYLTQTGALRVGVCHSGALLAHVPCDIHDIRMDAVMTPEETIWLDKHRRNGYG